MAKPRLFIGSSQKNLRVARVLAKDLEEVAEVTIWKEGVFGLNQHYLESLLRSLEEYDFAAFVLAADDLTVGDDDAKPSPRDNVLFESGLFMGVLGRDRVFLVHDQSVKLKIPSDIAGLTLASYDGSRIDGPDASAAVREASISIGDAIRAARFPHLVGEWRSRYPVTFEEGDPMVDEDIEIRPCRGGVSLTSRDNPLNDIYTAYGRLVLSRQLMGTWRSAPHANDMDGMFMLTVSPNAKFMYGYFTSPNVIGGTVYATWVLAKKEGVEPDMIEERLRIGQKMLESVTVTAPTTEMMLSPVEGDEDDEDEELS